MSEHRTVVEPTTPAHAAADALAQEAIATAHRQERKQNVVGGIFLLIGVAHLVATKWTTGNLPWRDLIFGGCASVFGALIMLPDSAGGGLRTLAATLSPFAPLARFGVVPQPQGQLPPPQPPVVVQAAPGQDVVAVTQDPGPAVQHLEPAQTTAVAATKPPPAEPGADIAASGLQATTPDA